MEEENLKQGDGPEEQLAVLEWQAAAAAAAEATLGALGEVREKSPAEVEEVVVVREEVPGEDGWLVEVVSLVVSSLLVKRKKKLGMLVM